MKKKHGLSLLLLVLFFITGFAFYSIKWTAMLIPSSALILYFILCLYIGFERVLMHAVYYFGLAMLFSIIVYSLLIIFPAWTLKIGIVLLILLVFSIILTLWRYYHGMLGRIQLHKWLTQF